MICPVGVADNSNSSTKITVFQFGDFLRKFSDEGNFLKKREKIFVKEIKNGEKYRDSSNE